MFTSPTLRSKSPVTGFITYTLFVGTFIDKFLRKESPSLSALSSKNDPINPTSIT